MINVAIVGATGYTGLELSRLLLSHPNVEITHLYANSNSGAVYSDIYPQFKNQLDLKLETFDPKAVPVVDILFLAVPHAQSHQYMADIYTQMVRVVDLSADFRLSNAAEFERYYNVEHSSPDLLSSVVYGLPELFYKEIQQAKCVANPGCYATSIILALFPLLKNYTVKGSLIVDAKSGVSGAGRGLKLNTLFCEASESFTPYSTGTHRHTAEVEEILDNSVFFSPHLVPMNRGILSSIYLQTNESVDEETLKQLYKSFYSNASFVNIVDKFPSTKHVQGSNMCLINISIIKGQIVIYSVIDNLLKGAAGQAVQNMNIMLGLDEGTGLSKVGHYL